MNKKILTIIQIFFSAIFILAVIFLVYKNGSFFGAQKIELSTFEQPMISRLGPPVRIVSNGETQKILEGPVYFDLRSMPWFKEATVYLIFKSDGLTLENMAYQTGPGFQYQTVEPVLVEKFADDWSRATFSFDLNAGYRNRNVRRFLISVSPNDDTHSKSLILKSLTLYLNK